MITDKTFKNACWLCKHNEEKTCDPSCKGGINTTYEQSCICCGRALRPSYKMSVPSNIDSRVCNKCEEGESIEDIKTVISQYDDSKVWFEFEARCCPCNNKKPHKPHFMGSKRMNRTNFCPGIEGEVETGFLKIEFTDYRDGSIYSLSWRGGYWEII